MDSKALNILFKPYVNIKGLECDGLTNVLSFVLTLLGIEHKKRKGWITVSTLSEPTQIPHFWIELVDGRIIDYKARSWMGEDKNIPHGIFELSDYPEAKWYNHYTIIDKETHPAVFDALTRSLYR